MKKARGFTLIELLVVMTIISVLAAFIFPVFAMVKEKGRQVVCLNNLKHLGTAMLMYADDWNGRLPTARIFEGGEGNPCGNWAGCYIYGGMCEPTKGQLYPYVGSLNVYMCPNAKGITPDKIYDAQALPYPLSYSMNALLSYKRIGAFKAPSTRVGLLVHEDISTIDDGDFNWMGWGGHPTEGYNRPSKKHNGGTCIIFCDMHARWQEYDSVMADLTKNKWDPYEP